MYDGNAGGYTAGCRRSLAGKVSTKGLLRNQPSTFLL